MAAPSIGEAIGLNWQTAPDNTPVLERSLARVMAGEENKRKAEEAKAKERAKLDEDWGNVTVDYSKYYGPIGEEVRQESQQYLADITKMKDANSDYGYSNEYRERKLKHEAFLGSRQMESSMLVKDIQFASNDLGKREVNKELDAAIKTNDPVAYRAALKEMNQITYVNGYSKPIEYDYLKATRSEYKPTMTKYSNEKLQEGDFVTTSGDYFNASKNKAVALQVVSTTSSKVGEGWRAEALKQDPNLTQDEVIVKAADNMYNFMKNSATENSKTSIQEPKGESKGLTFNFGGSGAVKTDKYELVPTENANIKGMPATPNTERSVSIMKVEGQPLVAGNFYDKNNKPLKDLEVKRITPTSIVGMKSVDGVTVEKVVPLSGTSESYQNRVWVMKIIGISDRPDKEELLDKYLKSIEDGTEFSIPELKSEKTKGKETETKGTNEKVVNKKKQPY